MSSLVAVAQTLTDSLQLSHPPIAVCFADAVPPGVPEFHDAVPAGCRFWQEAAKGTFATLASHHDLCSLGMYTHNLEMAPPQQTDLRDSLKAFADLGYVRPEDLPLIPVLERKAKVVVYGPLGSSPLPPDVVLLFVQAEQGLILAEASQQMEGGSTPAMSRPACGVVAHAANTGRTALSMGCCGARAYVDILTPDVALYAIPGVNLQAFAERVAVLAKANTILTAFHSVRRRVIDVGRRPSVKESLAAMQ